MTLSDIVLQGDKVYHLGLKKGQIESKIFLVGDPARVYKVAAYFDHIKHEIKHREFVSLTGSYQGHELSVIGTGIGTDNIEITLIELFALLCMEFPSFELLTETSPVQIIRIGTSGGIQTNIPAGTMAISSYALGLDNVGLYYDIKADDSSISLIEQQAKQILDKASVKSSRFHGLIHPYASKANMKIVSSLLSEAKRKDVPYVQGITASSPGFYGPSSRNVSRLKNTFPDIKGALANLNVKGQKVINMEMESSLLFHVATGLGFQAGTICPIISSPCSQSGLIDYDQAINQAIEIALEAMIKLEKKKNS